MRSLSVSEQSSTFRSFIATECGPPLTVRDARGRLYLLTTGALAGRPRLIAIDGADAILMSLAELEGILLDRALAKFVEGLKELPRRKVRNR
ncbi:hypothetical protein [Rhizobium leguminosarum]|uniref:hypothetical protein n=1 Tax=Rhizobium leguminosarum TaxID=384 RepID=UPI001C9612DE|nr:hypothetical protein [Rhizobium leguminosarum]MBY5660418.1 hypothetical protein [Rhizobium leguminosarum]MBY5674041.1 hypothetical protein [Rhizobium leguminosarum]